MSSPTTNQITNTSQVNGITLTDVLNALRVTVGDGSGDMVRAVYDTDNDGKVDVANVADSAPWAGITGKPTLFPAQPYTHEHTISEVTSLQNALDSKQETLVSGGNIKSINGVSILGVGDMVISSGSADHGGLTGLTDDDHIQYHNDARGDARYAPLSHTQAASTVSFTQTGTGAVSQTVDTKLKQIVSVKDFGAVGDGVTNDSAAVQLAANTAVGKCLFFPPGSYSLVNGVDIIGNNIHVTGVGATIIYPTTTETYYHCLRIQGNNCRVSNLRIQSPSGLVRDDTGFGVCFGDAVNTFTNASIDNCIIDGIGSAGIWFTKIENAVANNNLVVNCLADGIHFSDGCFNMVASGNVLRNNGDDNIAIVNSVDGAPYVGRFTITGNTIYGARGPTGLGVALIGAVAGVVSNNTISDTVAPGIGTYVWTDTYKSDKILIIGNKITNCGIGGTIFGGCGIILQQSNAVAIVGNSITNLTYDGAKTTGGINASSSTRLTIKDNIFDENACDQVIITGATEAVISGNVFGYTARQGVLISGSVTKAVVKENTFTATAGTNDISINLPSGTGIVTNNSLTKAVSLTASTNSLSEEEVKVYTPTVTSQVGTLTTASGSVTYQRRGKFVFVYMSVSITTNGTGDVSIIVTLPFTPTSGVLAGRENSVHGSLLSAVPSGATIAIRKYDNSYPGANGASMTLSGLLTI